MTDGKHVPTTRELRLTRRKLIAAAAAASATALVAACAPAATGGPATSAAGAAGPVKGGTLRLPIFTEPIPLNPVTSNELSSLLVRRVLYSYLTRLDPVTKEPVGDLAEKWETSKDGLTWTFFLRNNVKWHDGAPFSADDVVFTFEQILDPKNTSVERSNYLDVTKVEAVDKNTVRFTLKNALMSLPVITGATVGIIPKHLLDGKELRKETKFNNEMPIGTGPFKIKQIVAGDRVEMVAFEDFYRGRPNIDTVIWKLIPDINARVAQLKAGELDYATLEPANLQAIQGDDRFALAEYDAPEYTYFIPNHKNPILSDKRVRQALVYGLDRKAILDTAALGHGKLMTGSIPAALKNWYDADLKPYAFDVAKAKALLDDAGWKAGADGVRVKDGKRMALELMLDNSSALRRQMSVLAQQYWKAIGVDITIKEVDRQVYGTILLAHTFDINISNTPSAWDPDTQRRFYLSDAGSNFGQYANPKADDLMKRGVAEVDVTKRKAIYKEFQQFTYEDLNVLHGYFPTELRVTSKKLKGLPDLPLRDVMTYMDSWYLEK